MSLRQESADRTASLDVNTTNHDSDGVSTVTKVGRRVVESVMVKVVVFAVVAVVATVMVVLVRQASAAAVGHGGELQQSHHCPLRPQVLVLGRLAGRSDLQ